MIKMVNVRVDDKLLSQFDEKADDVGLTRSVAIRQLFNRIVAGKIKLRPAVDSERA